MVRREQLTRKPGIHTVLLLLLHNYLSLSHTIYNCCSLCVWFGDGRGILSLDLQSLLLLLLASIVSVIPLFILPTPVRWYWTSFSYCIVIVLDICSSVRANPAFALVFPDHPARLFSSEAYFASFFERLNRLNLSW